MNLATFIKTVQPAIDSELRMVIMGSFSESYSELQELLCYHMGWEGEHSNAEAQGKRIRPLLVLMSTAACGGDWKTALPAAAAVELVHNFSLIHDDVEDQSHLRRGRPTLWSRWGAALAINAGDAMFSLANLALLRLSTTTSAQVALQAAAVLQLTCLHLTGGQHLDLAYEDKRELPLEKYWPMVAGKTAALLAASTELGALVAGANAEKRNAFHQFGYSLGIAFQVQDDWLGIWGDAETTGKSNESDLVSGKKTLPVLFGLEKDGLFAKRWRQGPIRPHEVRQVAQMLAEEGADAYVQKQADQYTRQALDSLAAGGQGNESSDALRELAERMLIRKN